MFVKCEGKDIKPYIESFNLKVVNETPDGYQLKVTGEKQAGEFLTKLVEDKVTVIKFELREPSLHEIFVEKVGDAHEE
jgi:ABC-2 type transport system ATP-binding protein